jgi:hypothetical protein
MWLHIPRILAFVAGRFYKLLLEGLKNYSHRIRHNTYAVVMTDRRLQDGWVLLNVRAYEVF